MAEEEEKKEGAEGEAAAKPKSKKKLIIIIAVVVLLVAIGVPLALLSGKEEAPAGEESENKGAHEDEKHYLTYDMDTIIVNLSENTSFLKVTLIVEYDPEILAKYGGSHEDGGGAYGGAGAGGGEKKGGIPHEIAHREPMIKDAVIRVLSSKRPEEVLTLEGKERLKEEIIEAINEASGLEEGPIVNIYFKDFIIQ